MWQIHRSTLRAIVVLLLDTVLVMQIATVPSNEFHTTVVPFAWQIFYTLIN